MQIYNRELKIKEIKEEFEKTCPWIKNNILSIKNLGSGEVLFEINDGSIIVYDSVLKCFFSCKNRVELINTMFPQDEDEWKKEFSYRLYREFIVKGYTQDEISEVTGISSGAISNYTTGYSIPTITNLIKIARALKMNDKELLRLLCYK